MNRLERRSPQPSLRLCRRLLMTALRRRSREHPTGWLEPEVGEVVSVETVELELDPLALPAGEEGDCGPGPNPRSKSMTTPSSRISPWAVRTKGVTLTLAASLRRTELRSWIGPHSSRRWDSRLRAACLLSVAHGSAGRHEPAPAAGAGSSVLADGSEVNVAVTVAVHRKIPQLREVVAQETCAYGPN